jgi:hypothetical protein
MSLALSHENNERFLSVWCHKILTQQSFAPTAILTIHCEVILHAYQYLSSSCDHYDDVLLHTFVVILSRA